MDDFRDIIERYLAGELNEAEQRELAVWLEADEANRQAFLAEVDFFRTVRNVLIQEQQDLAKQAEDLGEGSDVFDAKTLSALREIQQAAQDTPPVPLEPTFHIKDPAKPMPKITAELVWSLIPKRAVLGGAAAALLIVGSVFALIYIAGQSPQPNAPLVNQPAPPAGQPNAPAMYPVAMLSGERDAQWRAATGTRLPSVGDALHAGQRFTLVEGFAQITTHRGAVAIIEAPATVELTHNDNALELIQGKLVGICETPSSKGFVVSTPHLDITDLGTRFGIDASSDSATEVHVFEGEVRVQQPTHLEEAYNLVQGQALRAGADTTPTQRLTADIHRFASTRPVVHPLHGTGAGLAVGETDTAWTVVAKNGKLLEEPIALAVKDIAGHIQHLPNDPKRSQWLAWLPEQEAAEEQTRYRVRTAFHVPDDIDPASAYLTLQFVADNHLVGLYINGQPIDLNVAQPVFEWRALEHLKVEPQLIVGKNTIEFEIVNFQPRFENSSNHAGLRVEWQLHGEPLTVAP